MPQTEAKLKPAWCVLLRIVIRRRTHQEGFSWNDDVERDPYKHGLDARESPYSFFSYYDTGTNWKT